MAKEEIEKLHKLHRELFEAKQKCLDFFVQFFTEYRDGRVISPARKDWNAEAQETVERLERELDEKRQNLQRFIERIKKQQFTPLSVFRFQYQKEVFCSKKTPVKGFLGHTEKIKIIQRWVYLI